ncbi:NAD-dependent succinate-semialdehyde dehydrogenase [Peribacillus butanolivorans]
MQKIFLDKIEKPLTISKSLEIPLVNRRENNKLPVKQKNLNQLFIDGEWVEAESEQKLGVYNPATGELIEKVSNAGYLEASLSVDAAYNAFPEWSEKTAQERSELLLKWFSLIMEHKEEIASIITAEQGKPLKESLGEITYAASFVSWYAEEAKRIYGETIPASDKNKRLFVLKQPIGVVAAITPWNFPAAMLTRKIAPALAAGCTAVIKPAKQTPLTALKLVDLADKAGIPRGVLNIVTGNSKQIGDAWLKDHRVRKITFTGSTEVGKLLLRGAADNVKKVSLELGGHAPVIVLADADVDKAVRGVVESKFRNSGQTCVCANRIYVDKSIMNLFVEKLKSEVSKLTVGIGDDPTTCIGPLIDEAGYNKVHSQIEDALEKGATIECGGKRMEKYKGGFFYEPTILSGVNEEMVIMSEETFGPVAPIIAFDDPIEVLKQVNNTSYGLAAYAYTESLTTAIHMYEKLEYGIIGINDGMPSTAQAPFGGVKESGLGREGGHHGIDEFLEVKYVSIKI